MQTVLFRQFKNRIHVAALSKEMHGHDRLCFAGDFCSCLAGVDVETDWTDIDENGSRSAAGDATRRGKKREGGDDHLVTGANAKGHQSQQQRVGAGTASKGVFHAQELRALQFKRLNLRSHDELPGRENLGKCILQFLLKGKVLRIDIQKWNFHTIARSNIKRSYPSPGFAHGAKSIRYQIIGYDLISVC